MLIPTRFRFRLITSAMLFVCASILASSAFAQNKQYTENKPDQGLKSAARIDPSTLGMSVEIPFGGAPGRGTSVSSVMRYSSKQWRIKYAGGWQGYILYNVWTQPKFSENSTAGWTSSLDAPWIEYTGSNQKFDEYGSPLSDNPEVENYSACYVPRIHLHLPDGSSHELRQSDTPQCLDITEPPPTFSGNFYSTDGSRMLFNATAGVLYLPDGGRYSFGAEQTVLRYNNEQKIGRWATQYLDRNGNKIDYSFTSVTDTLGRVYANPLAEENPTAGDHIYTVPGVGGQNLTYTLRWRNLGDAGVLSAGTLSHTSNQECLGPNTYQAVSPYLYTSSSPTHVCAAANVFNPVVLSEVVLPTGQTYQFKYNIFGEIDKIIYPTGGYERFRYEAIPTLAYPKIPYDQANRGVVERWVSPSGDGSEESTHHWTYSFDGSRKATTVAPDGTRTERYLHGSSSVTSFGFESALAGMSYDERTYNTANVMLRRSLTEWQVSGPQPGGDSTARRDPRVIKNVDLLLDTGGNALAATSTMQYDSDLNNIATSSYDYASVDQTTAQTGAIESIPLGTLVRTQEATYLVNDAAIEAGTKDAYRARNLVGLLTSSRVRNAGGSIVAQSEIKYDEAAYPLLTYGAISGWTDPATTVRGLPTTTRSWLNTTGAWLETHTQYDQSGSVRNTWDGRGNQSQVEYSSTYAYAYPTLTRTPVPDPTGQHGSNTAFVSTTVYDFNTALVTSTTDANNVTTTFEYNDDLNRLSRTVRASGTAIQSQTSVDYDDANRLITTTSDQGAYNDNVLKSQTVYDGLGRTKETRAYEGVTNYIVTQQEYDSMGRVFKTSNPFRPWQSESAVWTTTLFDNLGRVFSVTTPDSAVVNTSYSGNTVTVTDQAQKARKSVTDGLGRLKEVYEDPAGLNYLTSYGYDVLDNLTTVSQGEQTRTFVYDSLKRLTSATNPESGGVTYQYDPNGNLLIKTDARGIVSTYAYDALNRNIKVDYSDTTGINPDITRIYDSATYGKGRLRESYSGGSETVGAKVDHTKVVSYDALGRPKDQRQRFKTNNNWSVEYQIQRGYDLAGNVNSQTYPSGRTVNYSFDNAGRTSSFAGNLGDGVSRNYATGIEYSRFGGMTKEQFGTTQPVYHNLAYNARGQACYIAAGAVNDGWGGDYGKFIYYYGNAFSFCGSGSDNNGNISLIDYYLPGGSIVHDHFEYDSLNRLTEVFEQDTAPRFKQKYNYDRYGNRTIDAAVSWGGVNEQQFTVNTANNRLGVPSGQSGTMTYDAAGNLTTDTYSGSAVTRVYDADNRMVSETQAGGLQAGAYTYNADGQRVRRKVNGVETWQVYGMDGELLAEYAANGGTEGPQKEYGYRNGGLLVTAEAGTSNTGPENVIWTAAVNVSVSGNNLTKTGSVGWNAGAVSTQSIASGDGYVEFTANSNSANTMCGLSYGNTSQSYEEIDFAFYPWIDGNVYVFENGVSRGSVGPYAAGDVLRVAVEGGAVKYRKNGALLYTSTVTPTYPLLVDTTLHPTGSQITTAIISNGGSGGSPQNAGWSSAVGVTISGHSLTKTSADGWNAGAVSTQTIVSGDGYVELTASEITTARMIGLGNGNNNQSYTDIEYAFKLGGGGALDVWEAGNPIGSVGTYATGDLLRVAVEGGVVKYRKNGTLLYSSTVAPSYPLLVDTSLYSNGSTLTNVVISGNLGDSGTQNVGWTNTVGVSVAGNTLTKTGTNGWNAGAVSTQTISSGDGYVEFTATAEVANVLCGLSNGDTNQSYEDIDFAFYPWTDSNLYVWEGGVSRGSVGPYTVGDVFRVAVEAGVVRYRKNGVLLYTSALAPTYPMLVDSTIFPQGGKLTNAVIGGNFSGAGSANANIKWLVTDHLGTPRMVIDQTGSLASVKRHDYLPFGEELLAGAGGRTLDQGYRGDNIRQKFTSKERDNETGLDYFISRYYSSAQGRFTSADSLLGKRVSPQSLNRYAYVLNNPLRFIDPLGYQAQDPEKDPCTEPGVCQVVVIDVHDKPERSEPPPRPFNWPIFPNGRLCITGRCGGQTPKQVFDQTRNFFLREYARAETFARTIIPDSVQVNVTGLWVIQGQLGITADADVYGGLETPILGGWTDAVSEGLESARTGSALTARSGFGVNVTTNYMIDSATRDSAGRIVTGGDARAARHDYFGNASLGAVACAYGGCIGGQKSGSRYGVAVGAGTPGYSVGPSYSKVFFHIPIERLPKFHIPR